ncbi:unnamed protein product [Rhizophagus irregularis]|nr:unnamed protein product [Rhizophagus irregularis]
MEKTKFRSASQVGLPSSEEQKKPRFVSSGRLSKNKNPKIKICSGGLPKNENPKIWVGFQRTKTQRFGWASEERKPKGSGGLPKNGKRRTFKIRSGGFPSFQRTEKTKDSVSVFRRIEKTKILQWASEEQRKTKIHRQMTDHDRSLVLGSLEKVEPRFVSLVFQVDSDKQKKPKILLVGFQKIKIRKYIRIHE